jgi:hypothetical protein
LLSTSFRRADPGLTDELQSELTYIFAQLATINGFLGSMVGPSDTVPEEVAGIAFWSDESAFRNSIPEHQLHEVKLYCKVL